MFVERFGGGGGGVFKCYRLRGKLVREASVREWGRSLRDNSRILARTQAAPRYVVTSVFVGLHQSLFETLVFAHTGALLYALKGARTFGECMTDHRKAVKTLRCFKRVKPYPFKGSNRAGYRRSRRRS